MIIGIGCDIVSIKRIERSIAKFGQRFLERVFTPKEREDMRRYAHTCEQWLACYCAKRFATKEAVLKAMGTGLSQGLSWQDIEATKNPRGGKPTVTLTGAAREKLAHLSAHSNLPPVVHLSLSDDSFHENGGWAQAFVVIETL